MTDIILPFPDSRLSPNRRHQHRYVTDVRNIARNAGYFAIKEAGVSVPDRTPLHLYLTFCPPNNIRRDMDNLLASSKPAIDGMFQALGVDDSNTRRITIERGKPVKGGQVVVRIEVIEKGGK
jgi:crossover junction endodeoxyribonuclease RusA